VNKIIFDQTTGLIKATCYPNQDVARVMSNYQNVNYIEIDSNLPDWVEVCSLWVNPETLTLELKP
jgi:hypothetical protein